MRRYFLLYIGVILMSTNLVAQERCGVNIQSAKMQRNADRMLVEMDINLSDFHLHGNRVAVFTPAIIGESDSLLLRPVGIYSRDRWYQYLRSGNGPVSGPDEQTIRWSERPDALNYSEAVTYSEWMNGSRLVLLRKDYACCRTLLDEYEAALAGYREVHYVPTFLYAQPVAAEAKTRQLSGRAFIDFPVNRTEIYPEYRKNPTELAKIIATIDSVRSDKDVTVTAITIKGYASPESPWENNTRLAKGRTATLKQYVQNLYRFDENFIKTDYEPEDWAGLRAFVEESNLPHRVEILALIDDTTIAPDPKELKLKTTYPDEYKFLLTTVYPGLRHSDYTIEYMIRSFTDVNEIAELMRTAPHKLNLNEMMRYAQTLEPGSDDYNDVFETAVRMFPNDEAANLNAANSAMQRGDLSGAERYLSKAGETAEAEYARGVLSALRGDYDGAISHIERAGAGGVSGTQEVIDHIRDAARYQF